MISSYKSQKSQLATWMTWNLFWLAYILTASSSWNNSSASLLKIKVLSSIWILVCIITFWLHSEYASGSKDEHLFSLAMKWTYKNFASLWCSWIETMRIYISSCIEVSVPFLLWKHEKSFLHEAAGAL